MCEVGAVREDTARGVSSDKRSDKGLVGHGQGLKSIFFSLTHLNRKLFLFFSFPVWYGHLCQHVLYLFSDMFTKKNV